MSKYTLVGLPPGRYKIPGIGILVLNHDLDEETANKLIKNGQSRLVKEIKTSPDHTEKQKEKDVKKGSK